MKKSFLLVSALSVIGLANAQNNAAHIGIKDMARIDANQVAAPSKPITAPNAKAASTACCLSRLANLSSFRCFDCKAD